MFHSKACKRCDRPLLAMNFFSASSWARTRPKKRPKQFPWYCNSRVSNFWCPWYHGNKCPRALCMYIYYWEFRWNLWKIPCLIAPVSTCMGCKFIELLLWQIWKDFRNGSIEYSYGISYYPLNGGLYIKLYSFWNVPIFCYVNLKILAQRNMYKNISNVFRKCPCPCSVDFTSLTLPFELSNWKPFISWNFNFIAGLSR